MMTKYILALACFAAPAAFAASQAPTDATLNSVTEKFTLRPDGSIVSDYTKSMTYHTHQAFNSLFGETFVVYNPEFQKLEIKESKTTQSDGTVITAPANAFNEVLPSVAANSADYNGLREMVITHTGLEPGCTVDLSYTLTGTPDGPATLDIDRPIAIQGADVKEYTVIVEVPEGTHVNWSVTGSAVKPVVDGTTYTWTFRDIPAASGDRFAPYGAEGPRLSVTTAPSLGQALRPLTVETRDICRVPGDVTEGKTTAAEKADAIHGFIVSRIARSRISPTVTGGHVRQCAAVLESAFATEAEAALAEAKLMRAEGIDAQAVAVFPKSATTRSMANVSKYLVMADGRFFSPMSAGTYNAAIRADRDDIVTLAGAEVKVAPEAVTIDCRTTLTACPDSISAVTGTATVTGLDGSSFAIPAPGLKKAGAYAVVSLPGADDAGVDHWGMEALASDRTDAIELPYAVNETDTFVITLADGAKCVTKPVEKVIANAAGKVTFSVRRDGDTVTVVRTISLPKSVYPATEFPALRTLLTEWQTPSRRRIVID